MPPLTESVELVASVEPEIVRLIDEHRDRRQHWYAHDGAVGDGSKLP